MAGALAPWEKGAAPHMKKHPNALPPHPTKSTPHQVGEWWVNERKSKSVINTLYFLVMFV